MGSLPLLKTRYRHLYDDAPADEQIYPQNDHFSFGLSWRRFFIDFFGVLAILLLVFYFYMIAPAPPLRFSLSDPALMYPDMNPYVPSVIVSLLSILLPIAVVLLFNIFISWNKYDIYSGLYGAILAYCMALLLTTTLWGFLGGLRPHFLAKCDPDPVLAATQGYYKTIDICRNKGAFTQDTYHGFPSGHASTGFAGCTFVSSYFAAHFMMYRNGNALKVFFFLLPFVCACWLSLCRIVDYHHSSMQVFVGIVIGIISGLFGYKMAYVNGFVFGYGRWAHIPLSRY